MKIIKPILLATLFMVASGAYALPTIHILASGKRAECNPSASQICVYLQTQISDAHVGDQYSFNGAVGLVSNQGTENLQFSTNYDALAPFLWLALGPVDPSTSITSLIVKTDLFKVNDTPVNFDSSCGNLSIPTAFANYTLTISGSTKEVHCSIK